MPEHTIINSHHNDIPDPEGFTLSYWRFALAALSGVLMALPMIDPAFFLFSWFGFLPLFLSLKNVPLKQCYFLSLCAGLALYFCSSYWILPFIMNMKAYGLVLSFVISLIYWAYSAHVIIFIFMLWVFLSRDIVWERLVLFPMLSIMLFSLFPSVFPVQLGVGQSQNLLALQATDLVGIYGLDFMIALSNICLYELLNLKRSKGPLLPWAVCGLLFCLWFIYGYNSLTDWEQQQQNWTTKKIALVQPNDMPSIAIPEPKNGFSWSYPREMKMTEQLVKNGAEIVFWPESRYKGYFDSAYVRAAYLNRIKALGAPLVFQDLEYINNQANGLQGGDTYNSMVMLSGEGELEAVYHKQKRIPFSEYVPLIASNESIQAWVQAIIGDFLVTISKGEDRPVFFAAGMHIIPLICYEVLFPEFVAKSVSQSPSGSVLLAASFDAWFGQTNAPFLHLALSKIRAVENRLPLVHVINNGPSAVMMPSGQVVAQTEAFTETAVIIDMPYSKALSTSFYSQHPLFFRYLVYVLLLLLVMRRVKQYIFH